MSFDEKMEKYGFHKVGDSHAQVYWNKDWFGQDIEIHISGKGGLFGSVGVKIKGVGNFNLGHGIAATEFWSMIWKEISDV